MLLAITEFSSYLSAVGFVGCLVMIGYALLARSRRPEGAEGPRRAVRIILLPLVFLAVWLWFSLTLPLVAWLILIGDEDHWIYKWNWYVAGGLAAVVTLAVGYRVWARDVSRSYVRSQTVAAALLLVLFGAVQLYDFVQPIRGSTPEAAAQRALAEMYPAVAGDRPKLVEEGRTGDSVVFVATGESGSMARITVNRYGGRWWRVGGGSLLIPPPAAKDGGQGGQAP